MLLCQTFEELVQNVTERGHAENEARDVEARCEQLLSRNTQNNMERITRDLSQVKEENKAAISKLKSAGA